MRGRYSPRAVRDLDSISEYLSKLSPKGRGQRAHGDLCGDRIYQEAPEGAEATSLSDVRAKIVQRYRFKVFYRLVANGDVIEIIHVRHTSRRSWPGTDE
jgi:toxin ParE1/3/4